MRVSGSYCCAVVEMISTAAPNVCQYYGLPLYEGSAMKKKTVVALARLLAIDLWRWRTGRATLEDLGWVAA